MSSRRVPLGPHLSSGPGGGRFVVPLDCGAAGFGRTEVRVRARLDPGLDPVPENDFALGVASAGGERVIGGRGRAGTGSRAARRWLAPSGASALPGLQMVFLEPEALVGRLHELDALVTYDVSTRGLPERLVEDFLARGGGWLATAGWRFLEDWVPGDTGVGLDALLPLEPRPVDGGPPRRGAPGRRLGQHGGRSLRHGPRRLPWTWSRPPCRPTRCRCASSRVSSGARAS